MTKAWLDRLAEGASALGVPLGADALASLGRFADRLVEWNARIDLSAIKDLDEIREKHFLDSLAGVPLLRSADRRIVDLGSGGGFPGVALAIVCPDRAFVSVESRSKKAVFQRQVARELGLTNLEVRAERIESLDLDAPDLFTARALADLDALVEMTERWLAAGSHLLAWKASRLDAELAAAKPRLGEHSLEVLDRSDFVLPESGEPRALVRLGRTSVPDAAGTSG